MKALNARAEICELCSAGSKTLKNVMEIENILVVVRNLGWCRGWGKGEGEG